MLRVPDVVLELFVVLPDREPITTTIRQRPNHEIFLDWQPRRSAVLYHDFQGQNWFDPLRRRLGEVVALLAENAAFRDNSPPEIKTSFDFDYPAMGMVAGVLAAIDKAGLSLVAHSTLPDEAWWDDFYTPMARRIEELRAKYESDAEALGVLDQFAQEPEMHRRYSGLLCVRVLRRTA